MVWHCPWWPEVLGSSWHPKGWAPKAGCTGTCPSGLMGKSTAKRPGQLLLAGSSEAASLALSS